MGRKAKIQALNQVDGRNHGQESQMKSVDEIFGFEKSKFPTNNAKEYEATLKEMNKFALNEEAVKLGLFPTDDRFVLQERMLTEFSKSQNTISAGRHTKNQLKLSKQGLDLLAEGA